MRHLALAGLLLTAPSWTAQGVVTRLTSSLITVHGTTCRIPGGPIAKAVRQNYEVGAGAKILCAKGALTKIAIKPLPSVITKAPPTNSAPASVTVSGTITNVDGMVITIGPLTCLLDASSPDWTGLQDGEYLSSMRCTGNPLTLAAFTVG